MTKLCPRGIKQQLKENLRFIQVPMQMLMHQKYVQVNLKVPKWCKTEKISKDQSQQFLVRLFQWLVR